MKKQKVNSWEEQIKNELIDLADEYFPKIKPQGGNKGRGEAMVIVARALSSFDKIMAQEIKNARKEVLNQIRKNIDKHKCDFNFDFEKQKFKHKSYVALEDILRELEEKDE